MPKREEVSPGRSRYTVRRPAWPTVVAKELGYVATMSVGGAGAITLALQLLGWV